MSDRRYVCVSQSAGPFTKAFVTDRAAFVRRSVDATSCEIRKRAGPAMSRSTLDKLELRLALFGYDGVFYSLTFAPDQTPRDYLATRNAWDRFLRRLKRWKSQQEPADAAPGKGGVDYVYRIERLHDNWHLHCFLRDRDFPPAVVRWLWDYGESYDVPYDCKRVHKEEGYRCLARYFTKEVPEVGRHAWGDNRGLSAQLPQPKVTFLKNGQISVPRGAVMLPVKDPGLSQWGVFSYVRYLSPQNSAFILN